MRYLCSQITVILISSYYVIVWVRVVLKRTVFGDYVTTITDKLLTNVKNRDEPNNRQGAVYKIKCSDRQASYIGETGRNVNTRLTEHKRAREMVMPTITLLYIITELTNRNIDWDSAQCLTYSTNYFND